MADVQSSPRVMVIGVGNPYRSDDSVGPHVARQTRELGLACVTVIEASGEGTELLEAWQDADFVILIDAVSSGGQPGTIHRFDANAQCLPAHFFHCSTHALGVAAAVELARELNRLPSRLIIYAIEGRNFTAGTRLTKEVEEAASNTVERVAEELRNWTLIACKAHSEERI